MTDQWMQYVLIIDDDPANIALIRRLLTMAGYGVYSAENGLEGLEIASAKSPDLILLDVMMPGIDGYEVCSRLKENDDTRKIPVIFITGTGSENMGFQLGAVDYIRKPFSNSIIRARVKNHLELKQYQDYLESLVKDRTRELEEANVQLTNEIGVRRQAEEELKKYQDHLEELVRQRTAELEKANARLEREIVERKNAEALVRQSEEKYRSVFESTGSGMTVIEKDGTISMINAECEALTGFEKASVEGKRKWTDFIPPEEHKKIGIASRPVISGEAPVSPQFECRLTDARDRTRYIYVKLAVLPGTDRFVSSWIDITDRKASEEALKENEAYLRTIMATIQVGVLIVDPETGEIFDANPWAARMIGKSAEALEGRNYSDFVRCSCGHEACESQFLKSANCLNGESCDCIIHRENGERIHVRRSYARARLKNRDYLIQSLLDINDIIEMLKRQDINIELSKNILNLVNRISPRYTELSDGALLFFDGMSTPCHKQGGDHFFMRNMSDKTFFSLKDQSGHQVSCVLRSIITDLIHHAILTNHSELSLEEVITRLNYEILRSGTFMEDDFFTSVNIEIDHKSLLMRYVSAGHPPFLLIREGDVRLLPETGAAGTNIPVGILKNEAFTAGEIQLEPEDRLIFYTDGLIEMPENRTDRSLSAADLAELAKELLRDAPDLCAYDIMQGVLKKVMEISGERVTPFSGNTSGDDVTIFCMEIEDDLSARELCLTPRNTHDTLRLISDFYREISGELNARGFEDPDTRIWTVLEEGILNAWKHGNQQDVEKAIFVRWRFGNDFHLQIIDEGEGFNPCVIRDPTEGENITRTSGRGLFMIRYFSNSVKWDCCGRQLVTYFKKHPDPVADEEYRRSERFMKLWSSD